MNWQRYKYNNDGMWVFCIGILKCVLVTKWTKEKNIWLDKFNGQIIEPSNRKKTRIVVCEGRLMEYIIFKWRMTMKNCVVYFLFTTCNDRILYFAFECRWQWDRPSNKKKSESEFGRVTNFTIHCDLCILVTVWFTYNQT